MIGIVSTILITLVVLSILVLVHELGHFFAARAVGINVRELGLGFPPRVFALKRKGIDYSINAIPFGGFVRMTGEEDPSVPGGFAGKSIRARTLVIAAGSIMNLMLAWLIFSSIVALPFRQLEGDITIQETASGSPAADAGLKPGDVIASVNGVSVKTTGELGARVILAGDQPVTLRVVRDGVPIPVTLTPRSRPPEGEGPMGVKVGLQNQVEATYRIPLWRAPLEGLRMGATILGFMGQEIGRWVGGRAEPELAGPIGIAQVTGETARNGLLPLLQLVGLLSLNLGILNLLPIPALDGGRLPFLALEAIRGGRRLSPRRESLIHLVGFAVLLTLLLFVTVGIDIPRLINGENVLP